MDPTMSRAFKTNVQRVEGRHDYYEDFSICIFVTLYSHKKHQTVALPRLVKKKSSVLKNKEQYENMTFHSA